MLIWPAPQGSHFVATLGYMAKRRWRFFFSCLNGQMNVFNPDRGCEIQPRVARSGYPGEGVIENCIQPPKGLRRLLIPSISSEAQPILG